MRQLKIVKQTTPRDQESLDKYLENIGQIELANIKEEVELARKIKQGDKIALERLVKANLRFVVSVAKQYQNQGVSLPDLINEGNLGLIKAAQRFDETRGFKFISYAVWWIRQAILQAIGEQARIVRLPLNKIGSLNKINKSTNQLEQRLERKPSTEELAEHLEKSPYEIEEIMFLQQNRHISLDKEITEGEGTTQMDLLESPANNENLLMRESLSKEINRALSIFKDKGNLKEIIILSFGLNGEKQLNTKEISEILGISENSVKGRKDLAIRRLGRNEFSKKLLSKYLS